MIGNALIGALVGVASAFVIGPFGPILGGGVAGYLEAENGLVVGGISGAITAIPLVPLIWVIGAVLALVPNSWIALSLIATIIGFLTLLVTSTVLGAIGGYLGVYVRSELKEPEQPVEQSG